MSTEQLYYYTPKTLEITPKVKMVGRHVHVNPRSTISYCRPDWVMDISTEGGNYFKVGNMNKMIKRSPNIILIYPPFTTYYEKIMVNKRKNHSAFMIFSGGELLGFDRLVNNEMGLAVVKDNEGMIGKLLFEAPKQCRNAGISGAFTAQISLYKIATLLQSSEPEKNPGFWRLSTYKNLINKQQWITRIHDEMQKRMKEGISLDELASKVNCSITTLNNRYRKATGKTVWQAFLEMRINAVKFALGGDETLAQVAQKTGFCDEFHLSKTFHKIVGISPSEYRIQSKHQQGQ